MEPPVVGLDVLERELQEVRQRARGKRLAQLAPPQMTWLALALAWTEELATECSFPTGTSTLEDLLDRAQAIGLCARSASLAPGGKTVRHFWMPDAVRPEVLDHLRKTEGAPWLQAQAASIGEHVLAVASRKSALVTPVVLRWAELAARTASGLGEAGRWLKKEVRGLVDLDDTGGADACLRAARVLDLALGDELSGAVRSGERLVELAYRRAVDRRYLGAYLERPEQNEAFRQLVEDPHGPWALHYLGSAGVGKTSLLRFLTARLAPDLDRVTTRVDFDHLSPSYPVRRPGQLLLELADGLRGIGSPGLDAKIDDLRDRTIELHEALSTETVPADPLDTLRGDEFGRVLRTFLDVLAGLPQPVILILDTCEELTKLHPVGARLPSLEATFAILERVHQAIETVRVVFAGRRLLAHGGAGWSMSREAPEDLTALPAKAYLGLHVIRGFDRTEADDFLTRIKQVSLAPDIGEALLQCCREAAPPLPVTWQSPRKPDEDERYNPFDLALYADWLSEEPDLPIATITSGEMDPYVELRIVRRVEKTQPQLAPMLPAVALLRRFDKSMLRPLVQGDDAALSDIYRDLSGQEWLEYHPGDPSGGSFLEVHPNLVPRLEGYYRHTSRRTAIHGTLEQLQAGLAQLVREQRLAELGVIPIDAALRLLDAADAARLWDDVTRRIPIETDWSWTLNVTGRLLGQDGAIHLAGHPLRAGVRAVHIAALIHQEPDLNVVKEWQEVRRTAANYPDAATRHWVAQRAVLGQVACHRDPDHFPGEKKARHVRRVLDQLLQQATNTVGREWREQLAASACATLEAVVEWAEIHGARFPDAWRDLATRLLQLTEALSLHRMMAFAWVLTRRVAMLSGEKPEDLALPAFLSHRLSRNDWQRWAQCWFDWRAPESVWDRGRLESLRLLRAALVPGIAHLQLFPWLDGAVDRLEAIDAERLASFIVQIWLADKPVDRHELDRLARIEGETPRRRQPACLAHRQVPPLGVTIARGLVALGRIVEALDLLNRCADQSELSEYDRRAAERAKLEVLRCMRLPQRSRQLLARLARSSEPADVAVAWPVLVLVGGGAKASLNQFRGEITPAVLHTWWRSRHGLTRPGARQTLSIRRERFSQVALKGGGEGELVNRAALQLDALEAALLAERLGEDEPRPLGLDLERLRSACPNRAEDVLRLALRDWVLTTDGAGEAPWDPVAGTSWQAEVAFEEGELLALRLPDRALPLLDLAFIRFRKASHPTGPFCAAVRGMIAAIHAGNRNLAYQQWAGRLRDSYAELAATNPVPNLPEWRQLQAWSESPKPEQFAALEHPSWNGWLHRLFRCLVWLQEPTGEGQRTAMVVHWLTGRYGRKLPRELNLVPAAWLTPARRDEEGARLRIRCTSKMAGPPHPDARVPVVLTIEAGSDAAKVEILGPGLEPYRAAAGALPPPVREHLQGVMDNQGAGDPLPLDIEPILAGWAWEALLALALQEDPERAGIEELSFFRSGPALPDAAFAGGWVRGEVAVVGGKTWGLMADQAWSRVGVRPVHHAPRELADPQPRRVVHLIGTPTLSGGVVRLAIDDASTLHQLSGSSSEPRGTQVGDGLRLEGVPLVVVQGAPIEVGQRFDTDREQMAYLKVYGDKLFAAGAQAVLVLPPLPPALAERVWARLAEGINGTEKPGLARLVQLVRELQRTILEDRRDRTDVGFPVDERLVELALDIVLWVHPVAQEAVTTPQAEERRVWDYIKGLWQQVVGTHEGYRSLFIPIPSERTDVRIPDLALEPDRAYFRVNVCQIHLRRQGTQRDHWGAVCSAVRLRFDDQAATFSRVITLPGHTGAASTVGANAPLTEILPYRGGPVELEVAVLDLPGDKSVVAAFEMLQDFSGLVVPPLRQALAVSMKVTSNLERLLKATDNRVRLGLHLHCDPGAGTPLRPGYYAVLRAAAAEVTPEQFHIRDNGLFLARPGAPLVKWQDSDYLLLRVEAYRERVDWRLPDIEGPLQEAYKLLAQNQSRNAKAVLQQAMVAALRSPDLIPTDRLRLVEGMKKQFQQSSDFLEAPLGTSNLNATIATAAPSAEEASFRVPLNFDDLFSG